MITLKTSNTNKDILIDDRNYDRLKHLKIRDKGRSLCVTGNQIDISLSKIILLTDAEVVDHIDRNYLNCQIDNLRPCTIIQNSYNRKKRKWTSSKYKGVSWHKYRNKWQAYISVDKKRIWLGNFQREVDAAETYNEAAIKYHGEFAKLNII